MREGLTGVVAGRSAISHADADSGTLTYRGYPVQDLSRRCAYEQVAYLILHGELPDPAALAGFRRAERARRALSPAQRVVLDALPLHAHPVDALRTALSVDGAEWDASGADGAGGDDLARAVRLIAVIPAILGHIAHRRAGAEPRSPTPRGFRRERPVAPLRRTGRPRGRRRPGAVADPLRRTELQRIGVRGEDRRLHGGGPARRGGGRPAALAGPLHGGANEQVWGTMESIGDPARAGDWLRGELAAGRRVTGSGTGSTGAAIPVRAHA